VVGAKPGQEAVLPVKLAQLQSERITWVSSEKGREVIAGSAVAGLIT
jgi:hypothetical protein